MTQQWMRIIELADVPTDDVIAVQAGGKELAVYGVDGEVFATDNVCTHGHARLCDGFLEGHEIECPLHQGRFDIPTGEPKSPPVCVHLQTYPVRVENGEVLLGVPAKDDS